METKDPKPKQVKTPEQPYSWSETLCMVQGGLIIFHALILFLLSFAYISDGSLILLPMSIIGFIIGYLIFYVGYHRK